MRRRAATLTARAVGGVAVLAALALPIATMQPASAGSTGGASPGSPGGSVQHYSGLSAAQRATLLQVAKDTWNFYQADVDAKTALPLDNLTYAGGAKHPTTYGRYTSAANIGVYLEAVVSAEDLKIISRQTAEQRVRATLQTVSHLKRYKGFLHQWYDTSTGAVLLNPGQGACDPTAAPDFNNCSFVSNVDNGLYASGLIVVRQAMPALRSTVNALMKPMDFSLFYDARAQTHCNVNPAVAGNQPTGQMFGGWYEGLPPGNPISDKHYYHNGALYSDPRISAYIGMGLHQMPGDVWWRSWRELPPAAPFADCTTDPDFSWQGQWPTNGSWKTVTDPQSHQQFSVWEGPYTYPGTNLHFIPTYGGGMFEGLMDNTVVPETSWGPNSFGQADVQTVQVQIKYATEQLHYPVWGMSPSSTADDSGDYGGFGAQGLTLPYHGAGATASDPNLQLAQGPCTEDCSAVESTVTPHASFIALDVAPQQAFANIEKLRQLYPDIYGVGGFFDAVNPTTGSVGHRYLVLDQSMIMSSLDNALNDRAMQRHFAADPVSKMARTYLGAENMFTG
jgi:Putative glucoamylase/Protein of unknown function (DUF3131)